MILNASLYLTGFYYGKKGGREKKNLRRNLIGCYWEEGKKVQVRKVIAEAPWSVRRGGMQQEGASVCVWEGCGWVQGGRSTKYSFLLFLGSRIHSWLWPPVTNGLAPAYCCSVTSTTLNFYVPHGNPTSGPLNMLCVLLGMLFFFFFFLNQHF